MVSSVLSMRYAVPPSAGLKENRAFSDSLFKKIQSEKDYKVYLERESQPYQFFLSKFLYGLLETLMKSGFFRVFLTLLPYAFIILAIVLILLKITNVEVSKILKPGNKNFSNKVFTEEEHIEAIDLNKKLGEALEKKDFRLALRYYYLKILKSLHQENMINWEPYKSNHEYQKEISRTTVFHAFADVSRAYEYIWYGEMKASETYFNKIFNEAEALLLQVQPQKQPNR